MIFARARDVVVCGLSPFWLPDLRTNTVTDTEDGMQVPVPVLVGDPSSSRVLWSGKNIGATQRDRIFDPSNVK
jgi:hypothetical protein